MKRVIFTLVLIGMVLMLLNSIQTVSAYSSKTITVPAGNKHTIWTDLNTGNKFQVIITVSGGTNNDIDLTITDPQGKTIVSGRVNQQYSTEIVADTTGRYNFVMDNSISVVSDKQVIFSYQTVSQPQNPNTSDSNATQTQQQIRNYYVYVDPLPNYAPSYATNLIYDTTKAWMDVNPDIIFWTASDIEHANLYIQWIKDYGNNPLGETISGHTVQIGLGDSNHCGGEWQPFSSSTLHHVTLHEIGHFLGLQHSSDPNNIMYPTYNPEFGTVELEKNLAPAYFWFVPICSIKDLTSYYYSVSIDDPKYGIDVYFIPSKTEYTNALAGNSFQYYSGVGCHAENYLSYGNTCDGVGTGSGLLIMTDKQVTNGLTKVTVKMTEQPTSTSSVQSTTSIVHQFRNLSESEQAQQVKTQAEMQKRQAEDEAAQSQAAALEAQTQAEALKTETEATKAKAQADIEKAKLEAEDKIKQVSQAYSKKTFYREQIDGIKNSLNDAVQSISGLKFESSDAKKKIDPVWKEKSLAEQDIRNAENYWIKGSNALNKTDGLLAISYFDNITSSTVSSRNHLHSISNIIDDAKKTEEQYKKSRFCFLWWCW